MRDESFVLNLLTVLVLGLAVLDAPKPTIATVTTRAAPGDSFFVVGSWTASGAPDSALTRRILLTGTTADTAYHRLPGTVKRDSFKLKNPLPGDTAKGSFGVRSKWRNGRATAWASKPWTYVNPLPPPPVIDSVETKPDTVALEILPQGQAPGPKNQQQFCAFVGFRGGAIAQRAVQRQGCDSIYRRTIPLAQRSLVTAPMQARADSVCITWTHNSNGNIVAESCSSGLGLLPGKMADTTVIHLVPRGTLPEPGQRVVVGT
jgi:hypothetical protein